MALPVGALICAGLNAAELEIRRLPAPASRQVDFGSDIQPILERSCLNCHGPTKPKSGFRIDSRETILKGGESNEAAVQPGKSDKSPLVHYIAGLVEDMQMPPLDNREKYPALSEKEVGLVRAWIDQGANWPEKVTLKQRIVDAVKKVEAAPAENKETSRIFGKLREGDINEILAMSEKNEFLKLRDQLGNTPLLLGALYLDAAQLELLLKQGSDPKATNDAGATALMWALDDLEKVRVLLRHGAEVNAATKAGTTALMIACQQHGSAPVVLELLGHGADLHAKNESGMNALFAAAQCGDEKVLGLLLDRGADANSLRRFPYATALESALMSAAQYGHTDCVKLLLKRGADVHFKSEYGNALHFAAFKQRTEIARLLLDRGIDVNAKSRRIGSFRNELGLTALMYAAVSEQDNSDLVELLIERGADVHAVSAGGETAMDLARRRGDTKIVRLLTSAGAKPVEKKRSVEKVEPLWTAEQVERSDASMIKHAAEKGLAILLESGTRFTEATANRCASCHQQAQPALALGMARARKLTFDQSLATAQFEATVRGASRRFGLIEEPLAVPSIAAWSLIGFHAADRPADLLTDVFVESLARVQAPDGRWITKAARAPTDYSDVTSTALAIRALKVYAPPTMKADYGRRTAKAAQWLQGRSPESTEERALQILGLHWEGTATLKLARCCEDLLKEQREDGGWAQLPTLESDAYATGLALYALQQGGSVSPRHPAVQKGIRFLLARQLSDGSWWVETRASAVQVAIDGIFPHGEDQWISSTATSWSAMALMLALEK